MVKTINACLNIIIQFLLIVEREFPEKFGANEAFKELIAVEDWFALGWLLEIEDEQLIQIEEDYCRDDDRKLAMLKLWVELNPWSASWNSLTTALRKMPQHQALAEDIQENFLEQGKFQVEFSIGSIDKRVLV